MLTEYGGWTARKEKQSCPIQSQKGNREAHLSAVERRTSIEPATMCVDPASR